jgi:PhoPQ-activated pathogenicity-related protein
LLACYQTILTRAHLPEFSWTLQRDGAIRVHAIDRPSAVKLWQATNPQARDFRLQTLGPVWQGTDLSDQGGGVYVGKVTPPAQGWTAFFVEVTFPRGNPEVPFKFTTQVNVLPDAVPFKLKPNSNNKPEGFTHREKATRPGSS